MEPNNKTPVYYETAAYARGNGELELFRPPIARISPAKTIFRPPFPAISTGCVWTKKRPRRYSTSMVQSASPSCLLQLCSTNPRMAAFLLPTRIGHSLCICRKDSRQAALIAGATASLTLILPFWMASSGRLAEKSGSGRILHWRKRLSRRHPLPLRRQQNERRMKWKDEMTRHMDEKQYAVLLTETQDVKVIACNPDKDIFDIGREAIGCDWIELVEAEPLAKDGLLMMIDEEGKLKPGGALINATASALYGTEQHGDPIMGNAVIVRTTGENLELLTSGEAEQLAVRMEAVRDSALQKIAEAFARRPTSKQERSTSSLPRRQPCRKDNLER